MSELTPREILDAFDAGLAEAARVASLVQRPKGKEAGASEIVKGPHSVQGDGPSDPSVAGSPKGDA